MKKLTPFLIASLAAAPAFGQEKAAPQPAPQPPVPAVKADAIRGDEITPKQQAAVAKGLRFLAKHQQPNGDLGGSAVTALGALAFMSAGNLPGRGQYGDNVRRALEFVLGGAQESGLLAGDGSNGVMYAHGFATLFLAEVYGMTGDEAVKEKLHRAVQLIQRSQNEEGGWRYQPAPIDADISVTICQIMALRAARDAGIKVEKGVIDRAIKYVRACQNRDGGFSYMLTAGGGGGSAFPRSAAGVASLFYAGIYKGPEIDRGLKYLEDFRPGTRRGDATRDAHYFYGHYYGVQAMFLAGGKYWATWYPAIRDELIERQSPETGAWSGQVGDEYCTAMALIILQMPNRYLPVFTGKGPGS